MEKISDLLNEDYKKQMKCVLAENYEKYIDALNKDAVRGLRINTKKISVEDFVCKFGKEYNLKQVDYCKDGFVFESNDKIGFSDEHLSGLIYIQEPSSMLSVCASEIEKETRPLKVLDLCASPGGKTGQISCRVDDDSIIFSNEIIKSRAEILQSNIERQGFKNIVILNEEPKNLLCFENYFDYVFVDAPCSGEGMFRKNPETIKEWSKENVEMCAERQKEILSIAQKLVAPKGKLIYSTCTFNELEDEGVADWFLNNFDFELKDVSPEIKNATISSKLKNSGEKMRKFFPFCSNGEGQFVAVFENNREENNNKLYSKKHYKNIVQIGQSENRLVKEFSASSLVKDFDWKRLFMVGDNVFFAPEAFDGFMQTALENLKFLQIGVKIGTIEKNRFEPNHNMFMALEDLFRNKIELTDEELKKYLHGEELTKSVDCQKGYAVVTKNGFSVGGVKVVNEKLKNLYPRGLRN